MTYEFDANQYKQGSSHQQNWGEKLVAELDLLGDERILDLGCGDGRLTALLARRVPKGSVLGIDASRNMIAAACTDHVLSNLEFQVQDINTIDMKSTFNVIFSNATLHWIKDHNNLWQRVYQALAPAGIVRFNFAGHGNCRTFFEVVRQVMQEPSFSHSFTDFKWPWNMPGVSEYRALVNQFAFSGVKVWEQNADRIFPSAQALIKWIEQPSIVPFLTYLNKTDQQRFHDKVVDYMLHQTQQADGRFFETFRRINVWARK
jgi:trans-aconitate methyltransferase